MTVRLVIIAAAMLCLAGCGTPGAPRPPSLRLPETVKDLVATRQGSTIALNWSQSLRTTDGETIRALGPTLVCLGINDFPMTHCNQVAADLSQSGYAQCKPEVGKPVTCAVTLPFELQQKYPLGQATYAVEVLNANGRSAGLSNQVRVPMAPTLPPPDDIRALLQPDGVVLSWTGALHEHETPELRHGYRVSRRALQEAETEIGEVRLSTDARGEFVDRSFEWEKTYTYRVQVVTTAQLADGQTIEVRGSPSADVLLTTKDVFPPAAPQGVQAVASGVGQQPFVDLTWAPNTDSDLDGYNIYRHEEGQPAVKINAELAKAPSYRDATAQRGHKYLYAVSAVDLRGNESAKSAETSETMQ